MLVAPQFADYGLGRLRAIDPQDRRFRLAEHLDETGIDLDALPERMRRWTDIRTLDQGRTSECTRYALSHRLGAAPIMHKNPLDLTAATYRLALEIDEFPGEDPDEGTSIRAICKAAKRQGLITGYYWITRETLLRKYVRKVGPVILGIEWTDRMYSPISSGIVDPTGYVVGGHAVLVHWFYPLGWDGLDGSYLCQNSWGEAWGVQDGFFLVRRGDMRELLEDRFGEAAEPLEPKRIIRAA